MLEYKQELRGEKKRNEFDSSSSWYVAGAFPFVQSSCEFQSFGLLAARIQPGVKEEREQPTRIERRGVEFRVKTAAEFPRKRVVKIPRLKLNFRNSRECILKYSLEATRREK